MKREREQPGRPAPAPRGTPTRPQARNASPATRNSVPSPDLLATLQRTLGNAAVARLVQRSSVHRGLDPQGQPLAPSPRDAEADAVRAVSGPVPAHGAHATETAPAGGRGGEAAVQRTLAPGLPKGTAVVKHEDDGDSPVKYEISGFGFGSYLIVDEAGKKVRASPVAKEWGTEEGREESRRNYTAAREKELDPAAVAAKQKQADLDLGENYLSADYRRINPLLAALGAVGYGPAEIASPDFSFQSKEAEVLEAWRKVAIARGYADEISTEGWDTKHLRDTFEIFRRINGVWGDFSKPSANSEGKVLRGDSKHLYDSFGGILKPDDHPDGGYVTVNKTIAWPAILSTTYGDPLTHSYVAGKDIVWEFSLPDEHQGRSLGRNNQSEQEMTFPLGTRIDVKQILVRRGKYQTEKTQKYGESATVIVFADIL
ncbi:hypothetical protein [Kitasatospora sp. NPDC087314]|uniref:hypothetical protein n=1 Tax=Kitasatospora sp. NPDC087314 TaxID=3364068 RepID=UPI00380D2B7B